MFNLEWPQIRISGKSKSVDGLNNIFDHFPYKVEVYNITGERIYSNIDQTCDLDPKKKLGAYNIFRDAKIKNPEIYSYLLNVLEGETAIITSRESYAGLFNWYDPKVIYEITIYPVLNKTNEVINFVMMHKKIQSKDKAPEFTLDEQKKIEKDIAHSILTNISHELRTPLNWIIGFSELINNEKNVDKIKEFNKTIKRGGDLLLSQIEKLIEMSAIVKNTVELENSRFQINQVLLELYGLIKNELASLKKDITLHVKCELNEENSVITTDKIKLRQILINLLHNSVKFTQQGHIELGVFMTQENEYLFYVKDSGIGMDKAKQKYIFDIFKKGEVENFNEQYGLGLGLSISSNYVKNLGGEIWVDSEVGQGSTFCFTIKDMAEKIKVGETLKVH